MISLSNISKHYAGNYLFDSVSLSIGKRDRIGLIGRNGAGKSTLLKIITGAIGTDEGTVAIPSDYQVGYLPQEMQIDTDKTVFNEAYSALSEITLLEKKTSEYTTEIAEREDYESQEYLNLIEKLTEANERYEILGGGGAEAKVEKILKGLGFQPDEFTRPLKTFSGGWQMRVELAKLLLASPELILLDEPTNHLDIESIIWLEEFLKNYPGSLVIVSHDRRFLDIVTNRTIEISLGKIFDMPLPFSKFVKERKEQKKQLEQAYQNQQRQIAQTERFIERFRSKANLATRVQSKVKQLEKLDRIEIEEEDIAKINLRFPEPPRSGRVVVESTNLSKSFGDNLVLDNIEFAIERGERIAFVGKNGEGKSTLSKIIAGELDYDGDLKLGHNVQIGYYAQHQTQMLDMDSSVFDVIDRVATGDMRKQIRNLLGAFLFSGEDVYKKVKSLSGGEKSRLALAKLLLKPANFLVLDEPTNHLDMISKDVLKHAIKQYSGTLIIVSHDRDFLQSLTDKTFEFKAQKIDEHSGGIERFLEVQKIESLEELNAARVEKKIDKSGKVQAAKLERQEKKKIQKEQGKVKKEISSIEDKIAEYEEKIADLEELFQEPDFFDDPVKFSELQEKYDGLKKEISILEERWSNLVEELDNIN